MGIKLSSEYFIAQAMGKTGIENFGDKTFEEGIGVLIDSLNHDLDLTEGIAGYFQNQIIQILMDRIEITQLVKDHSDILREYSVG